MSETQMNRIRPPDYVWTYQCGDREPFLNIGKILCADCKLKEWRGEELPEHCPNEVKVDMGPKY